MDFDDILQSVGGPTIIYMYILKILMAIWLKVFWIRLQDYCWRIL